MEHAEKIGETANILLKIKAVEKDIMELKLTVLKSLTPSHKRIVSLKGIMKDVDVSDKDISSAKKSLYGKIKV
jgi:hypothetical protein